MATAASSANSVISSQSSTNHSTSIKQEPPQDTSSEIMDSKAVKTEPVEESKEVKTEPAEDDPLAFLNSKEHIEKFKRHEAHLRQYLMEKYFSDKTIFGGNIFDVKLNIDGQTITASRLPQFQSYLDPATFGETMNKGSSSLAETTAAPASNNTNEKPT